MKGYASLVRRVLLAVLALNALVAVAKLVVGWRANSLAVIGDGLHSVVDAMANVVALLVLRMATAPADEDHPFGHAKFETLTAFVLSGLLFLTAFELGNAAVERIVRPSVPVIDAVTLGVMLVTLAVNVLVAWWEASVGRREGSHLLLADAAQTRGDVFVTIAVLVGLFVQSLGVPFVDPLLALGVAGFIAWSAWSVFRDAMPVLTDRVAHDPSRVARIVMGVPGVLSVHDIRSRGGPRETFVQMHLVVEPRDVPGAHAVADEVERRVSAELGVKEVFVHVEPEDDGSGPPGTRGHAAA